METIMLNKEQDEVYQRLVSFMVGPESSIILDGSGGTGKSFLIEHFVRNIDKDTNNLCKLLGLKHKLPMVYLTATTNKAVENLANNTTYPVETIHSLLGLTVVNTTSGETKLEKTSKMHIIVGDAVNYVTVVIIDECSMIDKNLFKHIKETCANCKVIFVGDWCQLPPVKESISPVYTQGYSLLELHKIMRTSEKELYDLNKAVKSLVIDSKPITITTGSRIKKLNDKEALDYINNNFNDVKNDNLIVSYTNLNSIQYSKYIQALRGNTDFLTLNSRYVCNNAVHDMNNSSLIVKTEQEVTLIILGDSQHLPKGYYPEDISYRVCRFKDTYGTTKDFRVFEDPEDYKKVLNFLCKNKDWKKFYTIKDYFGDLRNRDSCTVHKSQGSTVNDVFIDLEDLMKCRQPDMVRRLLYVAISRARNNVYFYGDLKEKYGVIL